MIRKVRFALLLTLACFVVSLMVLLGSGESPLQAMPAQTVTPALGYLPLALRQPTLTPTATPTPSATPTPTATPYPTLNDGQYQADVGEGGMGRIFFRVSGGGAEVYGAWFVFQAHSYCDMATYDFTGSKAITEGEFLFQEKDGDTLKASLSCDYVSDTQAECTAVMGGIPAGCNTVEGIARWMWAAAAE